MLTRKTYENQEKEKLAPRNLYWGKFHKQKPLFLPKHFSFEQKLGETSSELKFLPLGCSLNVGSPRANGVVQKSKSQVPRC